ncbi:unnamed protein product [Amoebophrya sp. A25]|nr:unnamed protein product [Amoebophrya sp. A25]|eukprot:GSA25T00001886001.1
MVEHSSIPVANGSLAGGDVPAESVDVLVLGSGPCGLGAATRLNQLKHNDWLLVADCAEAGGLAMTDVTPEGFLFDMGGHVIFSHWNYFDQLLDTAVGTGPKNWNTHQRVSYVWLKNRWIPYPMQNNLYMLDNADKIECINGVLDAQKVTAAPKNFDEWILKVMGDGLAMLFMRPYNFKVWAYPTTEMSCNWLGERVATVDAKKVIANVIKNEADAGWGPNALFRFPTEGGTGGIWKKVGALLPPENQRYRHRITKIDTAQKLAHWSKLADDGVTQTGEQGVIRYNRILSTLPLDETAKWAGLSYPEGKRLHYSATHVVGIGLRGISPHELKCWLYFPEDDCPFYRCTVFSFYAKANCPDESVKLRTLQLCDGTQYSEAEKSPEAGPYWSLMFEVSESAKHKPVDVTKIVAETIQGAINTQLVQPKDEIVSIYHRRLAKGYPTPHVDRDECIAKLLPELKEKSIWSRGRFGAWKYELGNQDHTCMQGVEAVDNMLFGVKEFTLEYPDKANAKKNTELEYSNTPIEVVKKKSGSFSPTRRSAA